jgi:4-hydroxybenzoate polyprenyltransferase
MRPQQWVKNLFVLAPVAFAHRLLEVDSLLRAGLAFALFCAASSAVYLLNDLRDSDADRHHPLKRLRPIASGALSPTTAAILAVFLAAIALAGGLYLGLHFTLVVVLYMVLNLLYSWRLKHVVILDVMILGLGFVFRVEAGAAAVSVHVSAWILLCTIFLALFLAFSKRRHELTLLSETAADQRRVLDHYSPLFLDQMINVVTASTVISYSLFAMDPSSVERHGRGLVYTVPLVLFGIFRYLYLVYQRADHRNPTESLLTDPPFLVNILLWGLTVGWILYVQ